MELSEKYTRVKHRIERVAGHTSYTLKGKRGWFWYDIYGCISLDRYNTFLRDNGIGEI